jgi:pyruvate ferredoxin oxidoreductase alpha subunit
MATDLTQARLLTGGEAIVEAMCQIDPDVVPVYPITPQTPIIQGYAKAIADGRAHGEMVNVESEHSAMSAAIAAAVAGARTMTATSSQGLALMAEVVYIAASMRAPVVMTLGNRALSGPINIHCDHSDSMLIRDSGAIQLFAESAQEAYDLTVLAPRLAEHPDVLLPVIVCVDGFTLTHSAEPVELLDGEQVRGFVGEYRIPHPLLDLATPTTQGPFAMPDYYFELRRQQAAAIEGSLAVCAALGEELGELTGRRLAAVEPYRLDGARRALVCLGSTATTERRSACCGSARTAPSPPSPCASRSRTWTR